MASDGLNEEPVGRGGWFPIQPTRELSVKVLVVKGGFGSSNSSTAPRVAETRAECPAAGVPTPARSRTRSRERQSSTACAVAGRQFDTGRRNPNRPGLAGSARLVAAGFDAGALRINCSSAPALIFVGGTAAGTRNSSANRNWGARGSCVRCWFRKDALERRPVGLKYVRDDPHDDPQEDNPPRCSLPVDDVLEGIRRVASICHDIARSSSLVPHDSAGSWCA